MTGCRRTGNLASQAIRLRSMVAGQYVTMVNRKSEKAIGNKNKSNSQPILTIVIMVRAVVLLVRLAILATAITTSATAPQGQHTEQSLGGAVAGKTPERPRGPLICPSHIIQASHSGIRIRHRRRLQPITLLGQSHTRLKCLLASILADVLKPDRNSDNAERPHFQCAS